MDVDVYVTQYLLMSLICAVSLSSVLDQSHHYLGKPCDKMILETRYDTIPAHVDVDVHADAMTI